MHEFVDAGEAGEAGASGVFQDHQRGRLVLHRIAQACFISDEHTPCVDTEIAKLIAKRLNRTEADSSGRFGEPTP